MPGHDLMERTNALVQEHGTKWKTLTEILHAEGFRQDDGTSLTVEAIRKRYNRWIRQSGATLQAEQQHSQKKEVHGEGTDPEATSPPLESPHKTRHTSEAMVPVGELLELFKGTIERRDAMLAQKLKAGDEKQYAEDRIVALEARLEERLLTTLKEQLVELVEDLVDQELKSMVGLRRIIWERPQNPGGQVDRREVFGSAWQCCWAELMSAMSIGVGLGEVIKINAPLVSAPQWMGRPIPV